MRGEVRLFVHNVEGEVLYTERDVVIVSPAGEERVVQILACSGAGKRVLARISGVKTPEDAALLHGWHVEVERASLPAAAPGEHYVHDLLQRPVFDDTGAELGKLADVYPGERDIWVIATPEGEQYVIASPENVLAVEADRIVLAAGALAPGV